MLCLSNPFGAFPTINFPPPFPKLPIHGLPSLPSPLFGKINNPSVELMTLAQELQQQSIMAVTTGIIKPLLNVLNMSLSSFLPKIPGFPSLNIIDLMEGDKLVAAVKEALKNGFVIPGFSLPLYPKLNIPDMAAIHTAQLVAASYISSVANSIPALVKSVTDKLEVDAMGAIPPIPSMSELIARIPINIPHFKVPSVIDMTMGILAAAQKQITDALKPMFDFVDALLGVSIPTICIAF